MSLRVITTPPSDRAPSGLAERFWSLARSRGGTDEEAVDAVDQLLRILDLLRRAEKGGASDKTSTTLSLATLLRQQAARGDHAYSSPEQLATEVVTERSLVFSVGVLLFERLCHRHPFGADKKPLELVRMRRAELGSSVNYLPRLAPALRAILTRALSPLPEERYETVDDLAAALAIFSAHEPRAQRLPGAPPMPSAPRLATVSGSVRSRPISEWERLPSDVGADELSAPDLAEQMRVNAAAGTRRLARASHAPDAVVAPSPPPTLAAEPTPVLRRGVPKIAWLAIGVVAVGAAFAAGLAVAQQPSSDSTGSGSDDVAAAAPAVLPADDVDSEPAAPQPIAAPAEFAPDTIAADAATAAAECFATGPRLPGEFGVSLYFPRHDTAVRKVYFAADNVLTPAQQACVHRAAETVTAAASPGTPTTVELRVVPRAGGIEGSVARVLTN